MYECEYVFHTKTANIIVQTSRTTDASFAIPLFFNGQSFLRAVDHADHPAVVAIRTHVSPQTFFNEERSLLCVVHGDDFATQGKPKDLDFLDGVLEEMRRGLTCLGACGLLGIGERRAAVDSGVVLGVGQRRDAREQRERLLARLRRAQVGDPAVAHEQQGRGRSNQGCRP